MSSPAPTAPAALPRSAAAAASPRTANLVSVAVLIVGAAAFLGLAVVDDLPIGPALVAVAMTTLTQVLPGALIWRAVRPRDGWLMEDLAMGFAIGIGLAVLAQIVAGLSHQVWLATVLPLLPAVALLLAPGSRERIRSRRWVALPWWLAPWCVVAALALLPQLVNYFRVNRVHWAVPGTPQIDSYLHQALAAQLLHRGPVSWPTVLGEDLGYHWFTHAWVAHVSAVSGLSLDNVLLRFTPALMPLMVTVTVTIAMLRLTRSAGAAAVAVGLSVLGGRGMPFGNPSASAPTNPDSPTLALGVPTLLALVVLLAMRWRRETTPWAYVLVPLLSIVAAGTKGATSPVVVAGLALAAVAMFRWNRPLFVPLLLDITMVGAGLAVAFVLVFHGSSAGLALDPAAAAQQTYLADLLGPLSETGLRITAAALAVLGALTRAALSFAPAFSATARREPLPWLFMGASLAAAITLGVLTHPGRSQYYFVATAIPLAAMGSAYGLHRLWQAWGPVAMRRLLLVGAFFGLALYVVPVWVIGPLRRGHDERVWPMLVIAAILIALAAATATAVSVRALAGRAAAVGVALAVLFCGVFGAVDSFRGPLLRTPAAAAPHDNLAVTQGELDTARFIRDHSEITDLVMTNRHCTLPRAPFGGCDSRRWVLTAFSERQSLVEGWTATPRATRIAPHGRDSITVDYWKPEILRLNDGFIAAPDAAAHRRLWDLGVRWVYVESTRPRAASLEPYATLRYRAPDGTAAAWQLRPPRP